MASSLNKLVDSLVRQGSQKAPSAEKGLDAAVLPHWIFEGARLAYYSQRSEQTLDVVVEGISHSKKQVRFVFERDRNTWKSVSFAQIIAGTSNPLRMRAKAKAPPSGDGGGGDDDDGVELVDPNDRGKAKADGEKKENKEENKEEDFLEKMERRWGTSAKRPGKSSGPALSRVPQAWVKPDVFELDAPAKALDIDSSPEREAPMGAAPADEADPYGLEGSAAAAEVAALDAAAEAAGGRSGAAGAEKEPRKRSGRDRSPKGRQGDRDDGARRKERGRSGSGRRRSQRSRSGGGGAGGGGGDRRHRGGGGGGGSRRRSPSPSASPSPPARRRSRSRSPQQKRRRR